VVPASAVFLFQVNIAINGEKREFEEGLSVTRLIELLGVRPGRVVVELNRDVLSRAAHGTTILKEGDKLEIVHFVGGG
jgi:thiamine biosynthesis protein ThiS